MSANSVTDLFRQGTKRVLKGLGLEVSRVKYLSTEENVLEAVLKFVRPTTILDVGANRGQYVRLARRGGFRGTIVSFEAIPEVHAALRSASLRDYLWVVGPCVALGSKTGEVDINIAGNSASSSVLPMLEAHIAAAPSSRYVGVRRTRLERLDNLERELPPLGERVMLKIDTQGYEREVLTGAEKLLHKICALQIEMSLIPLYVGAPNFAEMLAFVESLGFEIFAIVPGLKNLHTGRLLQVDGFFVRDPSSPGGGH